MMLGLSPSFLRIGSLSEGGIEPELIEELMISVMSVEIAGKQSLIRWDGAWHMLMFSFLSRFWTAPLATQRRPETGTEKCKGEEQMMEWECRQWGRKTRTGCCKWCQFHLVPVRSVQ